MCNKITIWTSGESIKDMPFHEFVIKDMPFHEFVWMLETAIKERGFEKEKVLVESNPQDNWTDIGYITIFIKEEELTPKQKALNKLTDEDKKALGLV